MGLLVPPLSDFRYKLETSTGRPSTTFGANPTAAASNLGNNAFGTTILSLVAGSSVANDIYFLQFFYHACSSAAVARDTLVNIYRDPAGGTAWETTPFIPDLLISGAASMASAGSLPFMYEFPIFIKSGTSLGVAASMNGSPTGLGFRCWLALYGQPTRPVRAGSFVTAFGATESSSSGTAVTPGTTSDGSWKQLGSNAANDYWWWQAGFGINNAVQAALIYDLDLAAGDGTNFKILLQQQKVYTTTAETVSCTPGLHGGIGDVANGEGIYCRMQCSGTPDTGISAIAYGLGG